jgi:pimeloyl-ACP methyl ester carboxylesterase
MMEWVLIAAALYALLALGACALQDRLIFYPQPPGPARPAAPAGWRSETLTLAGADGKRLEGWLVRPDSAEPVPAVVYFGGNAEEVSWMAEEAPRFGRVALVLVNYRGYGRSEGSPGERTLFDDATRVFDGIAARGDVDAARIVAHGRSLGTAVAVSLASRRPVSGVLLTSPFDSVSALARRSFPWLPVQWLLRHPFESAGLAPSIGVPLLVLAAERDRVVPPEHSRLLFEAWAGPKRYLELPGVDHVDIVTHPQYWRAVAEFVRQVTGDR